jgi:hypothetical protein
MTTSQEVSSSKHKIDSLTSDFFRAVSFFEGNKPAYQDLYKLFIESGQLIKNSAILPEISNVRQFIEPRQSMVDADELTDQYARMFSVLTLAIACVRPCTLSLLQILKTCFFTVLTLRTS